MVFAWKEVYLEIPSKTGSIKILGRRKHTNFPKVGEVKAVLHWNKGNMKLKISYRSCCSRGVSLSHSHLLVKLTEVASQNNEINPELVRTLLLPGGINTLSQHHKEPPLHSPFWSNFPFRSNKTFKPRRNSSCTQRLHLKNRRI